MDEHQLLAAAEYAGKINMLDRMVNTSDRTRDEVDFTQRFPAPFQGNCPGGDGTVGTGYGVDLWTGQAGIPFCHERAIFRWSIRFDAGHARYGKIRRPKNRIE